MNSTCTRNIPVTLVSIGTDRSRDEIADCFRRLGCRVEDCFDPAEPDRVGERISGVAVVVLGRLRQGARRAAASIFRQLRRHPCLAILCQAQGNLDNHLLDRCSEFSIWPCSEQEIAARLDRLWQARAEAGVASQRMQEALLELNLVGRAPAFAAVLERVRKVSDCDAPVLIEGETGTGKELFARAFHYLSERRDYPFVPVNCGALPDHLLENELFGHERGAYTDAGASYGGLIAQADQGTLFLDEVETLSARAQVVLLRFLQAQEYRPLGATGLRNANVRVIAASNESLAEAVSRGRLREDLLFRMDVMRVQVPPLRERRGDIELLAEHFMRIFRARYGRPGRRLHPDSLVWMSSYDWPGNVRELENMVHCEFMLADNDLVAIGSHSVKPGLRRVQEVAGDIESLDSLDFREAKAMAVARFEQHYLEQLMERARGNVSLAARMAGKERSALGKLLRKHHIDRARFC